MVRFIINRLKGFLSSVFFISIISFLLLHLVPYEENLIEKAAEGVKLAPIQSETIEQFKRQYFLDRPLFINLNPKDRLYYLNKYFTQLLGQRESLKAKESLIRLGGTALPFILERVSSVDENYKQVLIEVLNKIAEKIKLINEEKRKWNLGDEEFWREFWINYKLDFTKERVRLLVKKVVRYNDELSKIELLKLDTYAIDVIMETLIEEEKLPYKAKVILSQIASKIMERGSPLPPDPKDKELVERILEDWEEWWNINYIYYTEFEGFKTITSIITETQFFKWIERIVTLDFGRSLRDNRKVTDKMKEKIWVTLTITLLATILSYFVGIVLGVFLGMNNGTKFERTVSATLFVLYSLPLFWVCPTLINIFAYKISIFPGGGILDPSFESAPLWAKIKNIFYHAILPVVSLSYISIAFLSRYQKIAFVEIMDKDFIRTAKAFGFGDITIAYKYALRNALIPIITLFGLQFPFLVGGSVIVEKVFQLPGVGFETFEAIRYMDYNWIMGMITITSIVTIVGLLLSDIILYIVDPRVREGLIKDK